MTQSKNKKRHLRDIQDQTGWSYMFCMRVVDALGYGSVSERIDAVLGSAATCDVKSELKKLGEALNEEMKAAAKAKVAAGAHVPAPGAVAS